MEKNDLLLLTEEICACLPYGLVVRYEDGTCSEDVHVDSVSILPDGTARINGRFAVEYCRPYIRTYKDMTDKECEENLSTMLHVCYDYDTHLSESYNTPATLTYLRRHHLGGDRLFIRHLALPAPMGMYDK